MTSGSKFCITTFIFREREKLSYVLEARADTGCKAAARGESHCRALREKQAIGRGAFFGICEGSRSLPLYFRAGGANRLLTFAPGPTRSFLLAAANSLPFSCRGKFLLSRPKFLLGPAAAGRRRPGFHPGPGTAVTLPRPRSGSASPLRTAACETVSVSTIFGKHE